MHNHECYDIVILCIFRIALYDIDGMQTTKILWFNTTCQGLYVVSTYHTHKIILIYAKELKLSLSF